MSQALMAAEAVVAFWLTALVRVEIQRMARALVPGVLITKKRDMQELSYWNSSKIREMF